MIRVYRLRKTRNPHGADEAWCVVRRSNGVAVYFGTKADCIAWLERNDGDENN